MEVTGKRHRPFGQKGDRIRDLLRGYPTLAEHQVEEMISIYAQLSILEVALLSADECVADQFDAFLQGHFNKLQMRWRDQLVFALAFVGGFALTVGSIAAAMR